MAEDMYTNGSAAPGSPAQAKGQEVRKVRLIQFEKVTEEPMVKAACPRRPGSANARSSWAPPGGRRGICAPRNHLRQSSWCPRLCFRASR